MDKRTQKLLELLESAMARVQSLNVQATAANIVSLYEALSNIQTVHNTLVAIARENAKEETEDGAGEEREADSE